MSQQLSTIQHRLQELGRPASLAEIRAGLSVPDRTLRRWLSRLVEIGSVEAMGEKKGRRYILRGLSPARKESSPDESVTSDISANNSRARIYRPNHTFYLSAEQRYRLRWAAQKVMALSHDKQNSWHHNDEWMMLCAVHSRRLDGAHHALSEARHLWQLEITADDSLDAERIQLLNYLEANHLLFQRSNMLTLNTESLRGLNYLLGDGLLTIGQAGAYQSVTLANPLSDQAHHPLLDISRHMHSLILQAAMIRHPHEQSLYILAHLSRLAPFAGANTATARLSANLCLLKQNLPAIVFANTERDDYEQALIQLAAHMDIAPLAEIYTTAYEYDCQAYCGQHQASNVDTLRVRYRRQRRRLVRAIVTDLASDSPNTIMQQWTARHIPNQHQKEFLAETTDDLARLAPFNLPAFGISEDEWRRWRQYCVEMGLQFSVASLDH